jgi:hypothetical protein
MKEYNYWCINRTNCQSCKICNSKGDLVVQFENEEEVKKIFCENAENIEIKKMGQKVSGIAGKKLTYKEIREERRERSKMDFKKEILPKFQKGSDEFIHFKKRGDYD